MKRIILAICLFASASAFCAVSISPLPKQQFDQCGAPCANCLLFTYAAGTTNKLATYTSSSGSTPNTNPIVLDSNGQADVYMTNTSLYKFVLSAAGDTDPPSNAYWTEDNLYGVQSVYSGYSFPSAGIPNSNGTSYASSYGVTGSGNVVLSNAPTIVGANMGVASFASTQTRGESDGLLATDQFATQIGVGTTNAAWTLQASRAVSTVYTNPGNGPLFVTAGISFFAAGDTATWTVNGSVISKLAATGATAGQQFMMVIVPLSGTYELTLTGSAALIASSWREF